MTRARVTRYDDDWVRRGVRESITDLTADGKPVPAPLADRDYSGGLLLRMPKPLHRELANRAAEENVSLNSLAVRLLAQRQAQHDHPLQDAPTS